MGESSLPLPFPSVIGDCIEGSGEATRVRLIGVPSILSDGGGVTLKLEVVNDLIMS